MAKKKPTLVYNPNTLTFEQKKTTWRERLTYAAMIFSGSLVIGFILVFLLHKFFPSPEEAELKKQIQIMHREYQKIENHLNLVNADLNTLRKRDEDLYRVIYQRDPISDNVWKVAETDTTKYKFREYSNLEIIADITSKLKIIRNKIKIQNNSYSEILQLVAKKDEMLNSIPSIQPVANKDLKRISSGFGWRIHPIYRIPKMHTGVDFTATIGTPIVAAGDGIVEESKFSRGYGNEILIDHGYGYKTRYAHLSKFSVAKGTIVKRGQKIGEVGNTGASVGPHLHYEVEYMGSKVDPALFFYNDLNSDQYENLINMTSGGGKAFD